METHGGFKLWLCTGANCITTHAEPREIYIPFNFVVKDRDAISTSTPATSLINVQEHGVPHPNIGLSRFEAITLPTPNIDSAESIDQWLAQLIRESSVFATHQLISEFISKNQLASAAGHRSPWFNENFFHLDGRVYVINPVLYHILMAGSKFRAQESALRILGRLTPKVSQELKQKAYGQVLEHVGAKLMTDFQTLTRTAITPDTIYDFADLAYDGLRSFNDTAEITHSQQVYPDPVLGLVPLAITIDPHFVK